jgi:hypothetical protein
MSLDVTLYETMPTDVYDANITHNLAPMAKEAGIYWPLWRPDEIGIKVAKDLIPFLKAGLKVLKDKPEHFKSFDAPNGWGKHEHFVPWVERYLEACRDHPTAEIRVSR